MGCLISQLIRSHRARLTKSGDAPLFACLVLGRQPSASKLSIKPPITSPSTPTPRVPLASPPSPIQATHPPHYRLKAFFDHCCSPPGEPSQGDSHLSATMASLEELDDLERRDRDDKDKKDGKDDKGDGNDKPSGDGDAEMKDAEEENVIDDEILSLNTQDILNRRRLLENDARIMKSEFQRLQHEKATMNEKIKENREKIQNNRQLPYLVGNVVELLDLDPTAESSEEGANIDLDATRVGKSAVIKTSTRQTIFLPLIGLVDPEDLKPGDLIGVNKDSYLILDTLPAEYDSRVKAMEVDEKPTEKYSDVGGLDKQIEELVEAIVWPMKEAERFKKIGIKAPKGEWAADTVDTDKVSLRVSTNGTLLTRRRCRRTHVRTSRDRKDAAGESLCRPDRRDIPQACWSTAGPDVHWRRCQTRPRLLRPGQGEGAVHHFHRRARRRRHETIRFGKVGRPRGAADDA